MTEPWEEKIEKRKEELGDAPSITYQSHYREVRNNLETLEKHLKVLEMEDVSDGEELIIEAFLKTTKKAIEYINKKKDREKEIERVYQAIGVDFLNRCDKYGFQPLVIESGEITAGDATPNINITKSSGKFRLTKESENGIFSISEGFSDEPEMWPIACHEFAHVVYPEDDYLVNPSEASLYKSEFFSDMVSAQVCGPIFLNAIFKHLKEKEDPEKTEKKHPAPISRINKAVEIVEENEGEKIQLIRDIEEWRDEKGLPGVVTENDERFEGMASRALEENFKENHGLQEVSRKEDEDSPLLVLQEYWEEDKNLETSEMKKEIVDMDKYGG